MIRLFKNRRLPLKNTNIDYKTKIYLIEKINLYLEITNEILASKIFLIEKVKEKEYSEDEAIKILGIDKLTSERNNLNRIQENLLVNKNLTNADISIINRVHSKMKLNFNIFKMMLNTISDPIDRIPKKLKRENK